MPNPPFTLYIHESILNAASTGKVSYIDDVDSYDAALYKTAAAGDFIQINSYINDQINKFYQLYQPGRNRSTSPTLDENGKNMSQRFQDLLSIQIKFQALMMKYSSTVFGGTRIDELNRMQKQNRDLQRELDAKLADIYGYSDPSNSNKHMLDSTIYTSVLLTILAICVIYYIFMKI